MGSMAELRPFASVDLTALRWTRLATDRHEFLLQSGGTALARLDLAGPVGSLAHATLSNDAWTLKRGGFLHPHVTVRRRDGIDLARLQAHLGGGTLSVVQGARYGFRRAGLLVPAWQFLDPSDRPIVHIEPVVERRRLAGGLVQVDPSATGNPDLPLLLIVGWYFVFLASFEDETVQATAAALSAVS